MVKKFSHNLPTIDYYAKLLEKDFNLDSVLDWSHYVKNSWDIGILELNKYSFIKLFSLGGFKGINFIRKLKLISHAFKYGQIRYGVFVATKK